MEYTTSADGISPDDLGGFFVGWPAPPTPEQHLALLRRSAHIALARDADRVIGFATALTDGVIAAYIPLLEVVPEFQHRGIGTELVRMLLSALRDYYMIDLVCDAALVPFYERLGMHGYTAAIIRNRGVLERAAPSGR
jgi:ribosomal protein S18 acetylase RimI-like enzyme